MRKLSEKEKVYFEICFKQLYPGWLSSIDKLIRICRKEAIDRGAREVAK